MKISVKSFFVVFIAVFWMISGAYANQLTVQEKQNSTVDEPFDFDVGAYSEYFKKHSKGKTQKRLLPNNFLSISAINQKKLSFGIYETVGYVVKVYRCPPCPEGALCKPCIGNYIVVSQEKIEFDLHQVTDKQVIIFVDENTEFLIGKRYRFLVRILDVKTTDQAANNIQLIYSKRLK